MSARKQPGRVTVYSIQCDAVGCDHEVLVIADRLYKNTVICITGDDTDMEELYWRCDNVQDAVDYAVDALGWQEGRIGIQRGHVYCPKHKE